MHLHRFCGVGTPVFRLGRKRRTPSRRVTFTYPDMIE
jgi:hypothetical protein